MEQLPDLNYLCMNNFMNKQINKNIWIFGITLSILFIASLHYTTAIKYHYLHEIFRALFYLPILLAAFRFRLQGAVLAAGSVVVIYLPHVVFQWGGDFLANFSRFLQMALYLIIAVVAGLFSKREHQEREKYQRTASELEKSYAQLQNQSDRISEIEDQLRRSEPLWILGELSASLAHEVRNPLGSIWGVVEILNEQYGKKKESKEFLEILLKEVKRLDQVVQNYSELARKPQLSIQSLDLREVAWSVVQLLSYKARKQDISLTTEFADEPLFIKADANQLQQVLINLILNSFDAIGTKGSVTIQAHAGKYETEKEAGKINLSIIDDGDGMPEEVREKAFDTFFTTKENGSGLGLAIVKRIADQHHWKLNLEHNSSGGAVVRITFPEVKMDE